jgi:hypothetical protein
VSVVRCHCRGECGGWVFEESYPGLRNQYTKLVNAVRQARVARGDAKSRRAHRRWRTLDVGGGCKLESLGRLYFEVGAAKQIGVDDDRG